MFDAAVLPNHHAPMPAAADADDAASPLAGLLAALRLGLWPRPGGEEAELLARVADWDSLVRLAEQHDVGSLAWRGLGALPSPPVDDEPLARLRQRRERAVRSSLRQVAALARAMDSLAERGIPCLVIKGVPLAQRLYGDACARHALDIDLLVAKETFAAARAALLASGFHLHLGFPETRSRRRWYAKVEKAETFLGHRVCIELHRRLLANPGFIDAEFDGLFERRASVRIGATCYPTLGAQDEMLYLMCHGAGHGWRQLKWLCDAALCLRGMDAGGRARAAASAASAGADAAWESMLLACRDALGLSFAGPEPAGSRRAAMIARSLPEIWRSGRMPPIWRKIPLRIALKPNARFALHELSRLMVEPDDWGRVHLPDSLFYLYFLLRPALWAKDALLAREPRGDALDQGAAGDRSQSGSG